MWATASELVVAEIDAIARVAEEDFSLRRERAAAVEAEHPSFCPGGRGHVGSQLFPHRLFSRFGERGSIRAEEADHGALLRALHALENDLRHSRGRRLG